jgi:excisionase family DNA binding protein
MQTIDPGVTGRKPGDTAPWVPISYSVDAAARATSISRARLYEAIRAGLITARKNGTRTLIERDELIRYVRSLPALEAT